MSVFQVRHGASGAILWTGEATSEARVLDVMAVGAGFGGQAELPESIRRGGLIVEALTFDTGRPATGRGGERVTGGVPVERRGTGVAAQGSRSRSASLM